MTTAWGARDTAARPEEPLGGSVTTADREEIVALLNDEMRAPLVALKALRASMEEGDPSPELARRMRRHTKSLARRLSLLLEDLALIHARDRHRLRLELEELDLADQLRRAADLFPDMQIHVQAPPHVRVQADSLRLQQLLSNLIHTAQRRGDRPVWLHATCTEATVTLRMTGAPPGGYELDIVRQLVEAHGGWLRHQPVDGTVTVTLRRAPTVRT